MTDKMVKRTIKFTGENILESVSQFAKEAEKLHGRVYIESGEYRVSGKALLGILSLDLGEPVVLKVEQSEAWFFDELTPGTEIVGGERRDER